VVSTVGQGAGKIGIDHVGHGDQEVVGQVYGIHGLYIILNPHYILCTENRENEIGSFYGFYVTHV
jgi:hypothetical protein